MAQIHGYGKIVVRIIFSIGTHRLTFGFNMHLLSLKALLLVGWRLLAVEFLGQLGQNSVSM